MSEAFSGREEVVDIGFGAQDVGGGVGDVVFEVWNFDVDEFEASVL